MLHQAETQLPKSREFDRHRDLFAQAGIHIWEGKAGRSALVRCVTRLGALMPEAMALVIERLFCVLTKGEPKPEQLQAIEVVEAEEPGDVVYEEDLEHGDQEDEDPDDLSWQAPNSFQASEVWA